MRSGENRATSQRLEELAMGTMLGEKILRRNWKIESGKSSGAFALGLAAPQGQHVLPTRGLWKPGM